MRSVERRYNNVVERNPYLGPYICFIRAVKGQGFIRKTINKWFSILIPPDEYGEGERQPIFEHLLKVTTPEEVQNSRKNRHQSNKNRQGGTSYQVGIRRGVESKLEAKLTLHSYED